MSSLTLAPAGRTKHEERFEEARGELFVLRVRAECDGVVVHRFVVASRGAPVPDAQVGQVLKHFCLTSAVELATPYSEAEDQRLRVLGAQDYREVVGISTSTGVPVKLGPEDQRDLAQGRLMVAVHYRAAGTWHHARVSN